MGAKSVIISFVLVVATSQSFAQKPTTPAKTVPKSTVSKPTPPAPKLGDSFSRAGLKALFAIQDNSRKSDEALEDVRVEMDAKARPDEELMYANLINYSLSHENVINKLVGLRSETTAKCWSEGVGGNKPGFGCENPAMMNEVVRQTDEYKKLLTQESSCVSALEQALRSRVFVPLPTSCK